MTMVIRSLRWGSAREEPMFSIPNLQAMLAGRTLEIDEAYRRMRVSRVITSYSMHYTKLYEKQIRWNA